jgi:glucose/arabinose dehydrogenase
MPHTRHPARRFVAVAALASACGAVGWVAVASAADAPPDAGRPPAATVGPDPKLVAPYESKSVNNQPKVIGWPEGRTPVAAEGLTVQKFAGDLSNPRWAYVLPDKSVLVAESDTQVVKSANRVRRLVDADGDGVADSKEPFADYDLRQPFGMLVLGDWFYLANTDGLVRFPYKPGQAKVEGPDKGRGEKVLELPGKGYNNHWTRNVIASPDGKKLYVTVGSASNVDEKLDKDAKDPRRAAILECNPDGSESRVFAGGLRNPVGAAFEPTTKVLWTVVNERDELGDDIVPDYLTSVKDGGFYGWPYAYFGQHEDPRHKGVRPDLVAKAIKPDYAVGSHTASLGLCFATGTALPERFRSGAFVGQHGSWNRSQLSGYRVMFVPFKDGKPAGEPIDVLTGFVADPEKKTVYGRPVGVTMLPDGSLLVCDDAGATVWRVSATK